MAASNANESLLLALCNHLCVDPKSLTSDLSSDVKTLCTNVVKSSQNGDAILSSNEVMKWIDFAEEFLGKSNVPLKALTELNQELSSKSVVVGGGLKPSVADVIVFSTVHSSAIGLSSSDRGKLPHLLRWVDYIQNKENFGDSFQKILLEKSSFVPPTLKPAKKIEESNAKKPVQEVKQSDSSAADSKAKTPSDGKKKKAEGAAQATVDKKKVPEKEAEKKDEELSVTLLKMQIGLIRKAWKHPSADSLLVEEIDIGEAKCRQVVSGLAKYCSPEDLTNRRVVLLTNVKPGKLRDVMSEGLVLCASNQDHTVVEPLIAPEGAKPGECVTFAGYEGKPEEVLNPKKKQLEKVTPNLFTDDNGVATFKGVPFMTSSGPCTSSIPKASIK